MLGAEVLLATSDILETIVTRQSDTFPPFPKELFHYATLETIQKIFEFDDLRLSHAAYSNDQRELAQAKEVISNRLRNYSGRTLSFAQRVAQDFDAAAPDLDAYIFCMCMGLPNVPKPQDMLSQWRAYAQDGRGGAIKLNPLELAALVYHLPGLRINPVIYERNLQDLFVDAILAKGDTMFQQQNPHAVDATVAALVFSTPLMKDVGFAEEREWRLIFMPLQDGPKPKLGFHPRRDFLAPFVTLKDLWNRLRLELIEIPGLEPHPPLNVKLPTGIPLVPIQEVMVGPSGHQPLNVRAMVKVATQWRPSQNIPVDQSAIPYRSVG